MYISFAWTTAAYQARRKKCTRRRWPKHYAARFHKGDLVEAYDRNPRNGGQKVGVIQLSRDPYLERTGKFPPEDYEYEGFKWMEENGILIQGLTAKQFCSQWILADELVYVVRFEPVSIDISLPVRKGTVQFSLPFG